MTDTTLISTIEAAWDNRDAVSTDTQGEVRDAVESAIALLDKKGVPFTKTDISSEPDKRSEMIERADGRRTVPQIFINGEGIGGCDDLYALDAAGKLDAKLEVASA